MKCKGCNGDIEYIPLARVKELGEKDYYNAGAALTHTLPYCDWFEDTPAMQIVTYINVAEYEARARVNEQEIDRYFTNHNIKRPDL